MPDLMTVLKYPGSKWRLADKIVSLMPPHKCYIEPFFGSGAFFRKSRSKNETINDLDGEIVNLFRVIRDQPEALERAVVLTPFARASYEEAWSAYKDGRQSKEGGDPVERARLTLTRYWQAHGASSCYKSAWKINRTGKDGARSALNWVNLPERIAAVVNRLQGVQIEQQDATTLIKNFAYPETLIYADPPYMPHTRKGRQYSVEMVDPQQHIELLTALLAHPGPVILSGYDNELYNDMLPDWMKLQYVAQAEQGLKRIETVWINFEPQMTML